MIIKNLFNTLITCNSYYVNTESDSTITVTVKCIDFNGMPVSGREINLYYDNSLLTTDSTNTNGEITYNYNCENDTIGMHTFTTDTGGLTQIQVHRDTGWQNVTYKSGYKDYNSAEALKYRVINNIVELKGTFTNNSAVTPGNSNVNFASIPVEYAPTQKVVVLQQGSAAYKFYVIVSTDGNLAWSRYGTTGTTSQAAANSWLNCNITYII